jgi:hypothetical protein
MGATIAPGRSMCERPTGALYRRLAQQQRQLLR